MSLMYTMLRQLCNVYRQPFAQDGAGAFVPTTPQTQVASGMHCQINRRSSTELQHRGGRSALGKYEGFIEYRTAVNLQAGDILTDVAPIINPTDFLVDAFVDTQGNQQQTHTQFKVLTPPYDPNGLHDHLELDLDVIEGRPMP